MTTRGQLPPQAYTREVLAQAYSWLRHQPDSIRSLAKSPDDLVGLYLRAKRNGDASLESLTPASQETFRSHLKNLAAELQQFTDKSGGPVATHAPQRAPQMPPQMTQAMTYAPPPEPPPSHLSSEVSPLAFESNSMPRIDERPLDFVTSSSEEFKNHITVNFNAVPSAPATDTPKPQVENPNREWDAHSMQLIRDVKLRLNLSSDQEAVRMMLVLGYDKLKVLLP